MGNWNGSHQYKFTKKYAQQYGLSIGDYYDGIYNLL